MAELGEADEAELQRLVAAEQQKAQFTAQVHHFMELCWDKCVEKPGSRLDSRTENCLSSCVDRFIDTTLAIPWNDGRPKDLLLSRLNGQW
uniref:Mitochondrial import inner membrane translocase subunit n=1 Tax=Rattus norvegicus TaxID=10116 RepID=A0A8I6ACB3_RAT